MLSQRPVVLPLALVLACAPAPATEAPSTPAAQQTAAVGGDSAVSATMLRVLAETADEFRTGRPVFLVAAYRFPHPVLGGFATRAAADSALAAAGPGHGVFGPYLTAADSIPASAPRVVGVRLEIETGGVRRTVSVNPDSVDALFFSESAFDKFVIPYYSGIYGPDFAAELKVGSWAKRPKGHCFSRMCLVADDGTVEMRPFDGPMVR